MWILFSPIGSLRYVNMCNVSHIYYRVEVLDEEPGDDEEGGSQR